MHLLQLVGGQVWPNFLPILAFQPSRVTFLTSADPDGKFGDSVTHIAAACREAGHPFESQVIKTSSQHPSISECTKVLAGADADLINLTGGSKPMSIAAYNRAKSTSIPSFYLDTRRGADALEITDTATFQHPIPRLEDSSSRISVRIALMAQGFPVPTSFKSPDQRDIEFSERAAAIRQDPPSDRSIAAALTQLRSHFMSSPGGRMHNKGKLRTALQAPIHSDTGSAFHRYLSAAADLGIVERLDPDTDFLLTTLDPTAADADSLRSVATHNFQLLEGVWFELALLSRLKGGSSYSDICWSVEADSENTDSLGETDLVGFDPGSHTLHFISCKISGPHGSPLDHIQGLRRRATKEGGKFSKAELWIFSPKSPESKLTLSRHCEAQGVKLHIFTEEFAR